MHFMLRDSEVLNLIKGPDLGRTTGIESEKKTEKRFHGQELNPRLESPQPGALSIRPWGPILEPELHGIIREEILST